MEVKAHISLNFSLDEVNKMSVKLLLYQLSIHLKPHVKLNDDEVSKYRMFLKKKYEQIASNLKENKKKTIERSL